MHAISRFTTFSLALDSPTELTRFSRIVRRPDELHSPPESGACTMAERACLETSGPRSPPKRGGGS